MKEKNKKTKEVETNTKGQMWIVVLIAIIVIALGCEFVYILNMRNSIQSQNKVYDQETIVEKIKMYTYSDLQGIYEFTKEFEVDEDTNLTANYKLYLYSDGTYVYDYSVDASFGIMGNYIIEGKEIILNQLFSHGSDVVVSKANGKIKLTINDDGSLTDKNNLLEDIDLNNIELKKKSSLISKDAYSLSEYVNGYISYLEDEAYK